MAGAEDDVEKEAPRTDEQELRRDAPTRDRIIGWRRQFTKIMFRLAVNSSGLSLTCCCATAESVGCAAFSAANSSSSIRIIFAAVSLVNSS